MSGRFQGMKDLLQGAAERAARYLNELDERRVAPSEDALEALACFDVPLQDEPMDPAAVLEELDYYGSPATIGTAGPRFFGFVVGGVLPASLAANWMAGAWDQKTAYANVSPATTMLEAVALRWMLDMLHLPRSCAGAFVTGTTLAHITALSAARHRVLATAGWNVEADGLFGAPPVTVIVGEEAHASLYKALGVVGFGRNRVVKVPVDANGAMRADALPKISGPTIVCAQIGNVNTGASDPVGKIVERARPAGAWVHVDGAFGLWARAVPSLAHLVEGVEHADSWATDCHKWLNVPYDSGMAFVRDAEALRKAMAVSAAYLPQETDVRHPSDYTPEMSRRARGVEIWAALRSLGRSGFVELVERNCRQARRFADGLREAGCEILNDVVLNQVLVSFGDAETTRRVIKGIQEDGTCWCGETTWRGRVAMRISVSSWATRDVDVERSLEAMVRITESASAPSRR